ncbi:MAG: DegT/DnrJ/EryC1/StrS family aminotransferase, partial [Candidatus Eisenbacteria sp.]|nr:DegT/DnrJ/EryC1/StrS family aminotransferase [Candidatus Eisenbacteria bacterium]
LRSGWLTVGPRTKRFEEMVAGYVGVGRAAALSSCTAGLHLGMIVLGVEEGDEVILPALNFVAGPNCAIHLGATPVLVDVDPETLNVTPETLAAAITERTKLIVPVHFGGRPVDIDGIMEVARSRGIPVLCDAAHAMGADYGGRKVGSVADATSFSFYVTKGITTGEGGSLTSPNADLVDRVGILSLHGMSSGAWNRYSARGSWFYEVHEPGYKYNMNDVQAALGVHQMEKVDEFRDRREEIARLFDRGLRTEDAISVPSWCDSCRHAWHLYPIRLKLEMLKIERDSFIRCLRGEGIGTSVHFIPVHYHDYYSKRLGHGRGSFPATEAFFERAVSLPIYPSMSDGDANDVVEAVRKLLDHYSR